MKAFISITLTLLLLFSLSFLLAEQAGWLDEAWVTSRIMAIQDAPNGKLWGGAAIGALLALDLFLPVPSSVLMTLSGTLLGLHLGWMVSLVGAMGSALLGFGACRRWGRPAFNRLIGPVDEERIGNFFERHGVWAILLSRSVPMLTEIVSCLAGLSALRFRTFAILALAGTWPLCVVYAWAGSRALDQAIGWAVVLAFVLPAIGFGAARWITSSNSSRR